MLEVKDAVRRSLATFAEVFSDSKLEDLRLEEVSLSPDEQSWSVTVSYKNPDYEEDRDLAPSETTGLHALMGTYKALHRRLTKTIRLKADDGAFIGIKSQWES